MPQAKKKYSVKTIEDHFLAAEEGKVALYRDDWYVLLQSMLEGEERERFLDRIVDGFVRDAINIAFPFNKVIFATAGTTPTLVLATQLYDIVHNINKPSKDIFEYLTNLHNLQVYTFTCVICGTTAGRPLRFLRKDKGLFPASAILFDTTIPSLRKRITAAAGIKEPWVELAGICCRKVCKACQRGPSLAFDPEEIDSLKETGECLICTKVNLANLQLPKPNKSDLLRVSQKIDRWWS